MVVARTSQHSLFSGWSPAPPVQCKWWQYQGSLSGLVPFTGAIGATGARQRVSCCHPTVCNLTEPPQPSPRFVWTGATSSNHRIWKSGNHLYLLFPAPVTPSSSAGDCWKHGKLVTESRETGQDCEGELEMRGKAVTRSLTSET